MKNLNLNATKLISLTIAAFGLGAICASPSFANEEIQYSEDEAQTFQIAAANIPSSNLNGLNVQASASFNSLAGRFADFVKETEKAAKPESLTSATSIGKFVDNSPSLAKADTIDGAKAFAVLGALRSQEFVYGINNVAAFVGRETFIAQLKANPAMVRTVNGYDSAKISAGSSLSYAFNKIENSHKTIHQASYDLQKSSWSKVAVDKQIHLKATEAAWNATNGPSFIAASDFGNNYQSQVQVNDKLIAAAALLAVGDEASAVQMLNLNSGKSCAFGAYLNLRMCLSATKYPYEHTFCLSKHGYEEFQGCAKKAVQ